MMIIPYHLIIPKGEGTYTNSVSFLTLSGRGNVPDHENILASFGDFIGLGKNPQKGVALSSVTPFTNSG